MNIISGFIGLCQKRNKSARNCWVVCRVPMCTGPMNKMNRINKKGFTLLEILIAMFILAIVLSIIFTSYTGTLRIINDTESQAYIYEMARIALERIQEDLQSAYFSKKANASKSEANKGTQFIGKDADIKGINADTLQFFSKAHIVLNDEDLDAGIAEISYYVKENEEGEGLVLFRSDTSEFEEKPEEGTGGTILCDDLFSVNFTYYDADSNEHSNWDSTKEEFKDRLPAMVLIELSFRSKSHPEQPSKFITGVALPMARDLYVGNS